MTVEASQPPRRGPVFRREERRELRYQLSVSIATVFSWLLWLVPGAARGWLGDRFGDLFYRVSTTYRANVTENLSHLPSEVLPPSEIDAAARHIFRTSARNFLDLITLPRLRRKKLLESAKFLTDSRHHLDEALARGDGVVLITAHLGCFDVMGQVLAALGYKLTVVTGRTTSRFIFDGVTHLRGANGMTMVEPSPSGVRRVIQALRRGECAVFLTDRDFFQNGLSVEFFGKSTTLPPGAVRIARERAAPIVPIFTRRVDGGHEMTVRPVIEVPRTSDLADDLRIGTTAVVAALEEAISATPDQWVMFQKVWPKEPAQPVRVFPVGSPLESELLERVASALPERRSLGEGSGERRLGFLPKDRMGQPPQSGA